MSDITIDDLCRPIDLNTDQQLFITYMNYELAKELYDAGFPLQPASMEDGNDSKRKHQIFYYGKDSIGRNGAWLYPTLSELIEACGDDFYSLVYALDNDWRCYSEAPIGEEFGLSVKTGEGAAPEEAVAKLYLALHGKTN